MYKYLTMFIFGSVSGLIGASVLFWFAIMPYYGNNKFQYGQMNGIRIGQEADAKALGNEFGEYDGHSSYKLVYEIKTTDVISIETNGVKTVRIIP